MESSVIWTTIPSSACVVIAILKVAYGSTLALQPTAYQARAVANEIRQLKFEDENTTCGTFFNEVIMIGVKLSVANLSEANLSNTTFLRCRSTLTDFQGADFSGVSFIEGHFAWIHFSRADLSNAILQETDLEKSEFNNANLIGATINGAKFSNALQLHFVGSSLP